MAKIINLTQHAATAAQLNVVDLEGAELASLKEALTFQGIPSPENIKARAMKIAGYAVRAGAQFALVGGAPYLMGPLEAALTECGVTALYAFSERISEERTLPDGTVLKVGQFHHLGWVLASTHPQDSVQPKQ